jgi:hypothetical protein
MQVVGLALIWHLLVGTVPARRKIPVEKTSRNSDRFQLLALLF